MGIFSWLFGQFIDIIEFKDDSQNTIVYRYPRGDSEIKYGAKLIVRESQIAVFVDKGEIADVMNPGTYELETSNLPILTDLQHWDHGFKSPFKADVYFVNTKIFTNLKWGTKNPIILRDKEFDIVRLKAFGTYEFKVKDPVKLLKDLVGTDGHYTTEEIEEQLASLIVSKLSIALAEDDTSILDLARNYDDFGEFIKEKLKDDFDKYGLELVDINVENISLPQEVEEAIDKRSARGAVGNLDEHLKYQSAESLTKGSGSTSEVASIATGIAMANQIEKSFNSQNSNQEQKGSTPPPINNKKYYIVVDDKPNGPHSIDYIKELVAKGELEGDDLIWRDGLKEWVDAIDELPELFKTTTPPPLPNE